MPLPVSIVIGTSIAVISSGYAFKKFVYDPHIAPHVEEWLATHRAAFSFPGASTRVAVPVPVGTAGPVSGSGSGHATPRVRERRGVPSQGRSSARKDPHATVISLRRRSGRKGSDETHELREALIDDAKGSAGSVEFKGSYTCTRIADDDDKEVGGAYGGYGDEGEGEGEGDEWGRPSAYELKESVVLGDTDTSGWTEKRSDATRGSETTRDDVRKQRELSDPPHPTRRGSKGLIDLTHPRGEGGAEDAEVREVIFNFAPSTAGASGASTPLRQQTSAASAGTGGTVPPYSALGGGINPFILGIAPDIHASPGDMPITLTLPGQAGSPGRVASNCNAGPALSDAPGLLDHAGLVPDTLGPESTTFSFLSLSQASSPEVPTSLLGSWTLGQAANSTSPSASASASESAPPLSDFASRLHSPPTAGRGGHGYGHEYNHGLRSSAEDEVVSLPETSTSGYEDAEYYSPETRSRAGSPARSPTRVVPAFPREWPSFNNKRYPNAEYEGGAGELGMVWADTRRGNGTGIGNAIGNDSGNGGGGAALRRGPLSVVSLSESEGWRSDDFEGDTSV
ncbi:hypothetical protein EHS25_008504 [Saitozyma podzolica]|uniref:Uncharacterized protein n=1 Tax=Saitozyma podzolica TaxID=1890683 RepID=A0A427YLV4_9TREE|nr:hypothetical protein EHS25_008504 [Saitozyma podzolica]